MSDDINDTDTIEKRITITIEDCPLPLSEDDREGALEGLEDELGHLLHQQGMASASITTTTGYRYAQVPERCPLCGTRLELRSYTYSDNGAYADASCADAPECGWRGTAVYRLIDLEGGVGATTESAVLTGDATPEYYPY